MRRRLWKGRVHSLVIQLIDIMNNKAKCFLSGMLLGILLAALCSSILGWTIYSKENREHYRNLKIYGKLVRDFSSDGLESKDILSANDAILDENIITFHQVLTYYKMLREDKIVELRNIMETYLFEEIEAGEIARGRDAMNKDWLREVEQMLRKNNREPPE